MVAASTDRATATNRLVRCLVGLEDAAGDAASLRHLVAVLARPLADGLGVQVALGARSRGGSASSKASSRAPASRPEVTATATSRRDGWPPPHWQRLT